MRTGDALEHGGPRGAAAECSGNGLLLEEREAIAVTEDALKDLPRKVVNEPITRGTGVVQADGHLMLEADVSGAEVRAVGHVLVHGAAERCSIESSRGSVFLLYGSLQYTRLAAARNIYVKHTGHSELAACEDVYVQHSILNSSVLAGRKIACEASDSRVIGGRLHAGDEIHVHSVGNRTETPTELIVESPDGTITFSKLYPGVRLEIGGVKANIRREVEGGRAILRGKHLRVLREEEV